MKKQLLHSTLVALLACSSACDTSAPPTQAEFLTTTLLSADLQLEPFDEITFTPNNDDLARSLTFTSGNAAFDLSETDFSYAQEGRNGFTITGVSSSEVNLANALRITLANDSPLATELRTLLIRQTPNFTAAEIQRILAIINPVGARLVVDSNNPTNLSSVEKEVFLCRITSDNRTLLDGFVSGIYAVDTSGFEITFREGIASDGRLVNRFYQIPAISTTPTFEPRSQEGRFLIELQASPNAIN